MGELENPGPFLPEPIVSIPWGVKAAMEQSHLISTKRSQVTEYQDEIRVCLRHSKTPEEFNRKLSHLLNGGISTSAERCPFLNLCATMPLAGFKAAFGNPGEDPLVSI